MKRLVVVGTGSRGVYSFIGPIRDELSGKAEVVGVYDHNAERMASAVKLSGQPLVRFTDFDRMLDETQPDGVIVTTVDATHAEYVVKSLERGLDCFSEKPLCTTAGQISAIRRAAAASKGTGYVTHNMRFLPDMEVLKQQIVDGVIGDVLHIQFTETLDRYHGADYFRRWHRFMKNSAGLMAHKSSHHFDLINWLAASRPARVSAHGKLAFYGVNGPFRGERCSGCEHASRCDFHADIFSDERMATLYRDAEGEDGYHRDGCVYDTRIDIPDTVSASISYENGIIAAYSLIAYASYESMRIGIEGTRGRLELYYRYGTTWAIGRKEDATKSDTLANDGRDGGDVRELHLHDPYRQSYRVLTAPEREGGHGGSDPLLRYHLFSGESLPDPLGRKAPLEEGIQAVLVGLAANASMKRGGESVDVQALAD